MNNKLTAVFLIVLISFFVSFTCLASAQQGEREIAKNQVEQVNLELEISSNEVMAIDSNDQKKYLDDQSKAQKDADMAQQQIDAEIELLLEQADQEAAQNREAMEKEEQVYLKQVMQETEQQAVEIEEIEEVIKSDLSN